MIVSKKLEIKVRELEEKGYSFIYIEDYVKGFYKDSFKSKIEIARNMILKGTSMEFILSVTKLIEQELKDYGVHLEICSKG
ncbi:hypothetical protein [Leptospira noguchii]|uniref:hypothetical protein n=1 Tax=Leptospira noguchii TaxID=28182 RepID=UPI001FB76D82|nr:hypothetical protein [Leptospira noguchii]UOG43608.1 hypothetical protein MAL05_19160 [Leptospira noguchii]UOG62578.1 hypothetical protein MAL07_19480 [Leptospira noguchii]